MYRALEYFKDLKDNGFVYRAGDIFPRNGYKPSESRIAELLSVNNRRGRPVIGKIEDKAPAPAPVKEPAVVEPAPVKEDAEKVAAPAPKRGRKKAVK